MNRPITLAAALALAGVSASDALAQQSSGAFTPAPVTDADRLAAAVRRLGAAPRDLAALVEAGELSLRLGDATAAAALFKRAEQVDPANGRVKAGIARILVNGEHPGEALRYFQLAERYGLAPVAYADDRGLAFDLVGEQERAQRDYRLVLSRGENDEVRRRYALSLGISGRTAEALEQIDALIRRSDRGAWRARAFILAMSGDAAGANRIASNMMPGNMASGLSAFFRRLPTLGPIDRAFAVHFGEVTTTPARLADARLKPAFPALGPDPNAPRAAAVQVAQVQQPDRRGRRRRGRVVNPPVVVATNNAPRPVIEGRVAAAAATRTDAALPSPGAARPLPGPVAAAEPPPAVTTPTVSALATPLAAGQVTATTDTVVPPATLPRTGVAPVQVAVASSPAALPPARSLVTSTSTRTVTGTKATPTTISALTDARILAANAREPVVRSEPTAPPAVAATSIPGVVPAVGAGAAVRPANEATPNFVPTPVAVAANVAPPPVAVLQPFAGAASATAVPGVVPAVAAAAPADAVQPANAPPPEPPAVLAGTISTPPRMSEDSILARIVAGISVPASELGVAPMPGSAPAPVSESAQALDQAARLAQRNVAAAEQSSGAAPAAATARSVSSRSRMQPPAEETPARRTAAKDAGTAAEKNRTAKRDAAKGPAAKTDARATKAKAEKEPADAPRIWVQVAGGASEGDLARAWKDVRGKAGAPLKGRQGYTTPLRATNRVLTGPFKTEAEARAVVNQLAKQGVSAFTFTSAKGQKVTRLDDK